MKNKKKLLVLLLLLLLASATVITTAFAKYTESKNAGGTAQVAKFGITIGSGEGTLFQDKYEKTEKVIIKSATSGTNVMAPGASGSLTGITVTGTPEVAAKVTITPTVTVSGWSYGTDTVVYYFPLVVKVAGTPVSFTDITTDDGIKTAIENAIKTAMSNKTSWEFEAGTDLSDISVPSIEWSWDFTADGADAKDTELAKLTTAPKFGVSYAISAEQIDTFSAS